VLLAPVQPNYVPVQKSLGFTKTLNALIYKPYAACNTQTQYLIISPFIKSFSKYAMELKFEL
jgi:hypothetical protein